MDNDLKEAVVEMLNEGMPPKIISKKLYYDTSYIYYLLHKQGITTEEIRSKVKNKYKEKGKKYNFLDRESGKLLFTGSQTEATIFFGTYPRYIWSCVHYGTKRMVAEVCED